MALVPLSDGVWLHTHSLNMAPGVHLPCNSTVLRVGVSGLVIVSPGPVDDDADAIARLGTVRWLIGPNLFHHMHLRPAQERFSGSRIAVAPGLDKKRKNLAIDGVLGEVALPDELLVLPIGGEPKVAEYVIYHRPSKTLVTTDLVFNMSRPKGFLSPLAFRVMGTWDGLAASRLMKFMVSDRDAFKASVRALLDLEIDTLVMAHGSPVHNNANDSLRTAIEARFGPL